MAHTCPGCGAAVEFSAQPAQVMRGDCPGCGHAFTVFEGRPAGEPVEESPAAVSIPCAECGEPATVRSGPGRELVVECASCPSTTRYAPAPAFERARGGRFGREERFERRSGPPADGRPGARPCRECGGPLRFSTSPDGQVVGECAQCGNRFTLPPRRDSDGRRPPQFDRDGARHRFAPRYRPRAPRSFGRRPPRDDDEEPDDRRKRRRRPRD